MSIIEKNYWLFGPQFFPHRTSLFGACKSPLLESPQEFEVKGGGVDAPPIRASQCDPRAPTPGRYQSVILMGVRGVDSSRIIWSVPIVAHRLRSRARGRGQAGNQQRSRKVPFAPASTDQRCRSMPPPRPPERGAATCSRGRFWGDSEPAPPKIERNNAHFRLFHCGYAFGTYQTTMPPWNEPLQSIFAQTQRKTFYQSRTKLSEIGSLSKISSVTPKWVRWVARKCVLGVCLLGF